MREDRIRILIVEDHFLARMALTTVIETQADMEVAGEAGTGPEAIVLFERLRPDIVLMDVRIPEMDGVETTEQIRKKYPKAKIIILTNYEGSEDVYRGLRAGASSYLFKNTDGKELLTAIRTVHSGRKYIPQSTGVRLSERIPITELTAREHEVLTLIVNGQSNKEIADALQISEKTVSIHVSHLLAKMQVADRTQAAVAAIQRGVVHLD